MLHSLDESIVAAMFIGQYLQRDKKKKDKNMFAAR